MGKGLEIIRFQRHLYRPRIQRPNRHSQSQSLNFITILVSIHRSQNRITWKFYEEEEETPKRKNVEVRVEEPPPRSARFPRGSVAGRPHSATSLPREGGRPLRQPTQRRRLRQEWSLRRHRTRRRTRLRWRHEASDQGRWQRQDYWCLLQDLWLWIRHRLFFCRLVIYVYL